MTIFVITVIAVLFIGVAFLIMFTNKKFEKLIQSDEYKNSKYEIVLVNGSYALRYKSNTDLYVDIHSPSYNWTIHDRFFDDCLGSKGDVISAFYYRCPKIITLSVNKIF